LAVSGVVLSDHVRSVDWKSRDATLIGIVPYEVLEALEERLATLLGIE
jgi:mRNA-degrading endonuclease toxin of MazEF toxin-antitoxin module